MSLELIRQIQGYLISSSAVISLVPSNNINIGWSRTVDSFPCIILSQVGGSDIGYLGYNTSEAGSKLRSERAVIQMSIFSRDSAYETYQIAEEIKPIMISGCSRKDSDVDLYDDEMSVYHKALTFSFNRLRED